MKTRSYRILGGEFEYQFLWKFELLLIVRLVYKAYTYLFIFRKRFAEDPKKYLENKLVKDLDTKGKRKVR